MKFTKKTKGFLYSLIVLLFGLYVSFGRPSSQVAFIAVVTIMAMMFVVNKFIKGMTDEIFISGFIIGLVEAYVFLIQPSWEGLPSLDPTVKLFFGIAIATRIIIFLFEKLDTPFKKPINLLLGAPRQ
jgi:hypothetical protein